MKFNDDDVIHCLISDDVIVVYVRFYTVSHAQYSNYNPAIHVMRKRRGKYVFYVCVLYLYVRVLIMNLMVEL